MLTQQIPLPELRRQILSLAAAPETYPFISVIDDYLHRVPDDDQIRAMALGALLRKGFNSVAAELAGAAPEGTEASAELRRVAGDLRKLPSERVDWSSTNSRFEGNLTAMRARGGEFPALADRLDQCWQEMCVRLTLHKANDGNWQVRAVLSDGRRCWLPAAVDHAGNYEKMPPAEEMAGKVVAPFLLDGVGTGLLVPWMHAETRHTFLSYSPAIHIVETNVRALTLALRLHDWSAALADERVYLFAGEDAWERWLELVDTDERLAMPMQLVRTLAWPGCPPGRSTEMLEKATSRRAANAEALRCEGEAIYAGRDAAYFAKRFAAAGSDDPPRILIATSRFTTFLQHSARDLQAAFERAGCATRLVIEERDHDAVPSVGYRRVLCEWQPDLILIIDHHRHHHPDRFIDGVPLVCWIQDELHTLFNAGVGGRLGPMDFTIGYGMSRAVLQCGYPEERFMPCRVPVAAEKFAAGAGMTSRRQHDLVYISHHSETPAALHQRVRGQSAGDVVRLMDAFYERTRSLLESPEFNAGHDLDALLAETDRETNLHCTEPAGRSWLMTTLVTPLVDRTLRHVTLKWAADYADAAGRTLAIYGRGWEGHPCFNRYAKGVVEHGGQLGSVIASSGLNLHCGLVPGLHQRVLEAVASGGLPLVRYHPFDFYREGFRSFGQFLERRGITAPTTMPLDDLPGDYVRSYRESCALTRRPVCDPLPISAEILLEHRIRCHADLREYYAGLAFPDFEKLTFDTPESLAARAEAWLDDPDRRNATSRRMAGVVRDLFSYDALVERLLAFLRQRLAPSESPSPPAHRVAKSLVAAAVG